MNVGSIGTNSYIQQYNSRGTKTASTGDFANAMSRQTTESVNAEGVAENGTKRDDYVTDNVSDIYTSEVYSQTNVTSDKTEEAASSEKTSKMQVWHQGKTLEE